MTSDEHYINYILLKKVKACEFFLSATLLLKVALETEEMKEVDNLLRRRQELMRVIEGMDRRIEKYRHAGPPDRNRQIVSISEDLKRVLGQIIAVNNDCNVIAAYKCAGLRRDLINVRREKAGIHGYGRAQVKTQKFLNIRT